MATMPRQQWAPVAACGSDMLHVVQSLFAALHGNCFPQHRHIMHSRNLTSRAAQRAGLRSAPNSNRQRHRLRVAQVDTAEQAPVAPAPQPSNGNGATAPAAAAPPPPVSDVVASPQQQQQRRQPGWQLSPPPREAGRPYVPQVDIVKLLDTLLGDPDKALREETLLGSTLVTDGGPARLFSPLVAKPPGAPAAATLPLMFYLPGIDGSGLAAYRQFPRLTRAFDLRCLILPRTDRTPFEQLVDDVAGLIRAELEACDGGRPVYLMGESFGGLLCLALALKLGDCVDRLVLVNPASSFGSSPWPALGPLLTQLPPDVYKLLPFALAPIMANPISMAMNDVDDNAPLLQQGSDLLYGLIDIAPQLAALRLVLPADTLAWRLQLLKEGSSWINSRLKDVQQRVLVLAGENDLLIPSKEEAERLGKALLRGRVKVLAGRSHALLQEHGVDLAQLMKAEGFYVTERKLSNGRPSTTATDGGGAAFGTTRPIQLPTPRELQLDTEGFVSTINRLTSPVFYSTTAEGRVVQGLSGVPVHDRPVLLIGNHQLFAGDMYPMVQEFVQELGVLPRGLAHPVVFAGPDALAEAGRRGGMVSEQDAQKQKQQEGGDGTGAARFSSFLTTYGAVPVNGRNMHKLLAQGEMVLLYPGGAREAFKRRGEAYKVIWPDKAEFVRMAAKFGATIVPFAAIGADEAITTHLNGDELERLTKMLPQLPALPFRLPWQQQQQSAASDEERRRALPRARVGVNATMEDIEAFSSPGLFTFNPPQRTYFIFRQPIPTRPDMDRATCEGLYRTVKGEVEAGLGYLLRMREQDPYKDLLPRLVYEASWGGSRKAPSFKP